MTDVVAAPKLTVRARPWAERCEWCLRRAVDHPRLRLREWGETPLEGAGRTVAWDGRYFCSAKCRRECMQ